MEKNFWNIIKNQGFYAVLMSIAIMWLNKKYEHLFYELSSCHVHHREILETKIEENTESNLMLIHLIEEEKK